MSDPATNANEAAKAASFVSSDGCCEFLALADPFLMPLVVVATAVAAWRVQLNILARRTAWDYIVGTELQSGWQDSAAQALRLLVERPERSDWEEFAARWSQSTMSKEEEQKTAPIFEWLNRREFVAIAILNGSMHMPSYAVWWGIDFIHEWKRASGFVRALRATERGDEDLWSHFERLALSAKFRKLAKWEELTKAPVV